MVVDDENDQAEKVPTVLEKQLLIHFLCFTTLVLNHLGEGTEANGMVKLLHNTLDEGNEGTEGLGGGVWEVRSFRQGPELHSFLFLMIKELMICNTDSSKSYLTWNERR